MFYAICIFSERCYGSWVQKILLSISRNDNIETKARILHHNVLVATKNLLFLLRFIHGNRGKNLNQEEMNIGNDIEISESLSIVQE